MTVKELIELLKLMPNHEVKVMLDCPHCGKSKEIKRLEKVVIVAGSESPGSEGT